MRRGGLESLVTIGKIKRKRESGSLKMNTIKEVFHMASILYYSDIIRMIEERGDGIG